MKNLKFTFDHRKGTQALNFFAIQEGGTINKMKALKLIFLADRYHLRKYGRLITNDSYVAMKHGPVPSVIKDIAEASDYLDDSVKEYAESYVRPINNLQLASVKKIDVSIFSDSDLEALQFAWDIFGSYDQFQLRDITHSYPEWVKLKNDVATGSCSPMDILDFLKDPTEKVDPSLKLKDADHKTFGLDEEDRRVRGEALAERSLIESFWR